jgi:hypothetical protein
MKKDQYVRLVDAGPCHCRWPMWHDTDLGQFPICGKPGFPFCEEHRIRAFSHVGPRKDYAELAK